MKKILLILCLIAFGQVVFAGTYVKGYYRKDGTYVSPYYRRSSYKSIMKSIPQVPRYEQERAVKVRMKSGNQEKIIELDKAD